MSYADKGFVCWLLTTANTKVTVLPTTEAIYSLILLYINLYLIKGLFLVPGQAIMLCCKAKGESKITLHKALIT